MVAVCQLFQKQFQKPILNVCTNCSRHKSEEKKEKNKKETHPRTEWDFFKSRRFVTPHRHGALWSLEGVLSPLSR